MLTSIRGVLREKTPTFVVVETSGVGFLLSIPLSTYETLGAPGQPVHMLTHLHVREDALQLFGFATEEERKLFQLLLSVTGIGPKVAQGILSGISVREFESAIRNQDLEALVRIPGVGKKTAERLVLELREKIGEVRPGEGAAVPDGARRAFEEAVLALVSLGYKRTQAHAAVQDILQSQPALSVEDTLRQALQRLSR
jgi:Holliday junction DNA helicase RuvA